MGMLTRKSQLSGALAQAFTSPWAMAGGSPVPLGVTRLPAQNACNFSIYSKHSTHVKLLLFTEGDLVNPSFTYEFDQFLNRTGRVWHALIPDDKLRNAKYYAYSIDGPPPSGRPHEWHGFKAAKILLDPFATS